MRDRYLQLFARLRRRPPSDAEPETDLIPAALDRQVQEAFPRAAVTDALREQVALICREAVESSPSNRPLLARNRRHWMRAVRWGSLGVAAAALTVLWMSYRPGAEALAATINAMEAVPVIHVVIRGDKGSHGEIWHVDGMGYYFYRQGPDREQLMVDDLTYQYRRFIPRRPDSSITEARVEVVPSTMADPKQKRQIWDLYTKAGMLKALQSQKGSGEAQMSWVSEGGRRLLRIHVPGPSRSTTFYSDAETGLIQRIEDEGPDIDRNPERIRWVLDYPSLASVDRSRFQYKVPGGIVVWDQTDGPARWARGDEATCIDRMKTLREALRRCANDHDGQWPASLRPALDPYVAASETFHCPLAPPEPSATASYEYHRPGELLAGRVLSLWNQQKADPSDPELMYEGGRLQGARPALLECGHHGRTVFSLLADGSVHRWYRQPSAPPVASAAPTTPAPLDPRAAALLGALEAREQRLSELMVTYDYRATHLVPWEVPQVQPGSGPPTKQAPGDFANARIIWARKGPKMLRDEQSRLPGGVARMRQITDGESVLLQSATRSGQPLSEPSAQPSGAVHMSGAMDVGLSFPWGALEDLRDGNWQVKYLGTRMIGRDRCVGLEASYRGQETSPERYWFDPSRGYVLRRAEQYQKGRLRIETDATRLREWAPGVFLATHLDRLGYLGREGKATSPTHRWTTHVREVRLGGLPESLFQPEQ